MAPVLEPNTREWTAYLPGSQENWIWFWDTREEAIPAPGSQYITGDSPIGCPLVFYRSNSAYKDLFKSIAEEFTCIS